MSLSRETLLSLIYRIASIGVVFVAVSLLVRNMGSTAYGAWATLTSTLMWVQLSDFGVGIVVRNRVATQHRGAAVEKAVAAALLMMTGVALALMLIYAISWRYVSVARDYPVQAAFMYISAFAMLPASVGSNVLQGLGLSRVTFQGTLVQMSLWLALVATLGQHPSITWLALGFSSLWVGLCLYQLWRALRELGLANMPFLRSVHSAWRELSTMLPTGGAFFLLQLTSLVLFNLGTYLTYTLFSSEAAARYDVLNKIYQIPLTLFNVVITVAWARIAREADAHNAKGLDSIQRALLAVVLGVAFATLVASSTLVQPFVRAYSHGQISVSLPEVMAFAAQLFVQMLAYAAAVFMNAVERLRIQLIFAVTGAVLFVPVFLLIRASGLEVAAVPLGTAVVLLPAAVCFNFYVRMHIIGPLRRGASDATRPVRFDPS